MKKVILIPDSFKGTMSSKEICSIMKDNILTHYPECEVVSIPVADGGEGSVDAFLEAMGGEKIFKRVSGPYLGESVEGYYGILPGEVAIIEMAAAASLPMVGDRKDPSKTTTYGVGELILDAASRKVKKIIIGLGGSATNDAAAGLAAALGIKFFDDEGKNFVPVGSTLGDIKKIDLTALDSRLTGIEFIAMCDIDNLFYGPEGAPAVYGPQKGADKNMITLLDDNMRKFADVLKSATGVDVQSIEGSGAAGGMGGGLAAMLHAPLQMGIETVLDTIGFDDLLEGCDFVYTGEGCIDGQSLRGKVVIGVARRAKKKGVKVIAFVGDIGSDIKQSYEEGLTGVFSINRVAVPYKEAKSRAKSDLALTVDNLMRFQKNLGI